MLTTRAPVSKILKSAVSTETCPGMPSLERLRDAILRYDLRKRPRTRGRRRNCVDSPVAAFLKLKRSTSSLFPRPTMTPGVSGPIRARIVATR